MCLNSASLLSSSCSASPLISTTPQTGCFARLPLWVNSIYHRYSGLKPCCHLNFSLSNLTSNLSSNSSHSLHNITHKQSLLGLYCYHPCPSHHNFFTDYSIALSSTLAYIFVLLQSVLHTMWSIQNFSQILPVLCLEKIRELSITFETFRTPHHAF